MVVERNGAEECYAATWWSSPAGRSTRRRCCCARPTTASGRPGERLRGCGPTLHVPRQFGAASRSRAAQPDRFPEDARAERFYFGATTGMYPDGTYPDAGEDGRNDVPGGSAPFVAKLTLTSSGEAFARLLADDGRSAGPEQPRPDRSRGHDRAALRSEQRRRAPAADRKLQNMLGHIGCPSRTCCRRMPTSAGVCRLPVRAPERHDPLRTRSGEIGARRPLQGARPGQSLRRRCQLFPLLLRRQPVADDHRQRARVGDHLKERMGAVSAGR